MRWIPMSWAVLSLTTICGCQLATDSEVSQSLRRYDDEVVAPDIRRIDGVIEDHEDRLGEVEQHLEESAIEPSSSGGTAVDTAPVVAAASAMRLEERRAEFLFDDDPSLTFGQRAARAFTEVSLYERQKASEAQELYALQPVIEAFSASSPAVVASRETQLEAERAAVAAQLAEAERALQQVQAARLQAAEADVAERDESIEQLEAEVERLRRLNGGFQHRSGYLEGRNSELERPRYGPPLIAVPPEGQIYRGQLIPPGPVLPPPAVIQPLP